MGEFTLRNKIDEAKADCINRYGTLDWRWQDEGLIWTVEDYYSSKGSVLDFTEDDWRVCKENGLSLFEVLVLCDEEYLDDGLIADYLTNRINKWRDDYGDQHAADSEVPKESMLGFVEDFYTWRKENLPMVMFVYGNK